MGLCINYGGARDSPVRDCISEYTFSPDNPRGKPLWGTMKVFFDKRSEKGSLLEMKTSTRHFHPYSMACVFFFDFGKSQSILTIVKLKVTIIRYFQYF